MTVWAIIPVKDFEIAKTRLKTHLTFEQRIGLAKAMYLDTLTAIAGSTEVEQIAVVTKHPGACTEAANVGAHCLDDPGQGLNPALEAGRDTLLSMGASTIVVLPSDIPAIRPSDVDEIVRTGRESQSMVIVSDHLHKGTNALLLHQNMPIPFCFGKSSLKAHLAQAKTNNFPMCELRLRRVECDCDYPEDIDRLAAVQPGPRTIRSLREMALVPQEPMRSIP